MENDATARRSRTATLRGAKMSISHTLEEPGGLGKCKRDRSNLALTCFDYDWMYYMGFSRKIVVVCVVNTIIMLLLVLFSSNINEINYILTHM